MMEKIYRELPCSGYLSW